MADPLLKIGDVAELLGVSVRTIRYYEEEGLLAPTRSAGGTRLYARQHLDRLRAILRLTASGHAVEEVKALARIRERHPTGDESRKAVCARLDGILAEIDSRLRRLTELRTHVAEAAAVIGQCSGCTNPPSSRGCPDCPVRRHLADLDLLNLIWDQDG